MEKILDIIVDFNCVSTVFRLLLAVVLGGLIGSERGRHGRSAGLRTHIIICVGAALTSLVGLYAVEIIGKSGDALRISAQVISGIGFLGVGTILVRNNSIVTGLTTAAGLWTTATIGIAVGYGFYLGSIVATVICIFAATVLSRLQKSQKNVVNFYAEIEDIFKTGNIVAEIKKVIGGLANVEVIPPKSNYSGHIGITVDFPHTEKTEEHINNIERSSGICFVIEETN